MNRWAYFRTIWNWKVWQWIAELFLLIFRLENFSDHLTWISTFVSAGNSSVTRWILATKYIEQTLYWTAKHTFCAQEATIFLYQSRCFLDKETKWIIVNIFSKSHLQSSVTVFWPQSLFRRRTNKQRKGFTGFSLRQSDIHFKSIVNGSGEPG
jgi:hypothetical protein